MYVVDDYMTIYHHQKIETQLEELMTAASRIPSQRLTCRVAYLDAVVTSPRAVFTSLSHEKADRR